MNKPNGYKPTTGTLVVTAPRKTLACRTIRRSPRVVRSGRPVRQARPVDSWRRIVTLTIEKFLENDNWEQAGIRRTFAVDTHV